MGIETIEGLVEDVDLGARRFDTIVLCQTVDHLLDIAGTLSRVRQLLTPGGLLFVDIVDFRAAYLRNWSIEDAVKIDHPYYLTETTMVAYLVRAGFEIVRSRLRRRPSAHQLRGPSRLRLSPTTCRRHMPSKACGARSGSCRTHRPHGPDSTSHHFMSRVLALVPARGGSKGIPDKNIRPLAGRTLLEYAARVSAESGVIDRIVLSTDSERIAEEGRRVGLEVPFLRPFDAGAGRHPDAAGD